MNGAVLMDTSKTTKIDRNASGRKLGFNDREVIQTKQECQTQHVWVIRALHTFTC